MLTRRLSGLVLPLLLAIAATNVALAADPPAVVVSIKPLHALVSGVMAGIATPTLLVTGAASPHDYALKPSDAAAIETARLVFWMGPALEGFLVKPLDTFGKSASIALGERLGSMIRPLRQEALHDLEDDAAGGGEAAEDVESAAMSHGHHEVNSAGAPLPDLHAWLDPTIAAVMVDVIARELGAADPERASRYSANSVAMKTRLSALDAELAAGLASVKDRPFIVFHDAYQYFERRYGLRGIGSLAVHPEVPPGAKRLAALRDRIEAGGAVCVFAEPQFESKLVRSLIEGTSARPATLDPLGVDLPAAATSYEALLRGLAAALRACLGA